MTSYSTHGILLVRLDHLQHNTRDGIICKDMAKSWMSSRGGPVHTLYRMLSRGPLGPTPGFDSAWVQRLKALKRLLTAPQRALRDRATSPSSLSAYTCISTSAMSLDLCYFSVHAPSNSPVLPRPDGTQLCRTPETRQAVHDPVTAHWDPSIGGFTRFGPFGRACDSSLDAIGCKS